jgi:hypothetical protein
MKNESRAEAGALSAMSAIKQTIRLIETSPENGRG